MKKLSLILLTAAFTVLSLGQVLAQATTSPDTDKQANSQVTVSGQAGPNFTDADKNGVCDNKEARLAGGKGANFVDSNNDGVCDHRGDANYCKGNTNCNKPNCQNKQNCCKGMGAQQRNGLGNQCPAKKAPNSK